MKLKTKATPTKNTINTNTLGTNSTKPIIIHKPHKNQLNLNKYIILTESKWLVSFDFFNKNNVSCLKTKTFIQQEMLKKKILFQGSFVPCYEHSEKDILKFINAFQFALNKLKRVHLLGFGKFLKGHVIQPVFKQYN